jgi:hypothetical protein
MAKAVHIDMVQIIQDTQESKKNTERRSADPLLDIYMDSLLNQGVNTFLQNILLSLVLPHQIYKRIMTRTLRKTTYTAI